MAVGPGSVTEKQLDYIIKIIHQMGWSQQYAMERFHLWYDVRISSLEAMSIGDASKFITDLKACKDA